MRPVTQRLVRAFRPGRIFPALVGTMVALVFLFAAFMRLFDSADFPTYGGALWWAVSTVTTVGYGDVVPKQPVGRVVAAVLMIAGFAFLSLLTGRSRRHSCRGAGQPSRRSCAPWSGSNGVSTNSSAAMPREQPTSRLLVWDS
jgi:hypothetical protein